MKKRTMNILGVMLLSAIASLTASAQLASQKPAAPVRPDVELSSTGNGSSAIRAGTIADASLAAALSVGWNYVHPTNCFLYNSGGYDYLFIYTKEGPYFWTTNFQYQTLIETDCQVGNWMAFYVYNSNGSWSEVYTYQYK